MKQRRHERVGMKIRPRGHASDCQGSTNLYADLGYRAPESMLVKAQLVTRIAERLAGRDMTETRAATTLGIPQPKLSKMLRGQFRGFSERKLMGYLTQLG
jgi:predicted XRE-type DNA-binding protein